MKGLCAVFLMTFDLSSCSRGDVEQEHHRAVVNGYAKLPIAKSLKARFGAWSFITHYNFSTRGYKDNEKEWQTLTFIHGRYEIAYIQKVSLDKNGGQVVGPVEGGKLYFKEMKNIILNNDGQQEITWTDHQLVIEGNKLDKLVESGWDFASVGTELRQIPLKNAQLYTAYWNRIYPLQKQALRQ